MFLRKFCIKSSTRNQYLSAFVVNIITLSHGCAVGWVSPFITYLKSTESHLSTGPVTTQDISWIGSLICIGGLIGAIAFGMITEKIGKKNALFLLVIPHLSFWFLIYFSTHVYHLYLARVLAGLTGGGCLRTISLYITEISENEIRGMLGAFLKIALSMGILLIFTVGTYADFFTVPLMILVLPTISLISLLFLHDTPASLISRRKFDEAFESLKFYRTCGSDTAACVKVQAEFDIMKKALENKSDALELKDFLTKPAKKGLMVGIFLVALNQFSGAFSIMMYSAEIFESSGSNLSPNESSIIVAFIQLIGLLVSFVCVDRFGRKGLMIVSCAGTSLFLCILATYSYLNAHGFNLSNLGWIPVASLSMYLFLASLGIIALPFIIITEMMPNNVRNIACTICMSTLTTFGFIVLKVFPPMMKVIQLHGCMWFFSGVCCIGAIATILFIPETKGKDLIQSEIVK